MHYKGTASLVIMNNKQKKIADLQRKLRELEGENKLLDGLPLALSIFPHLSSLGKKY